MAFAGLWERWRRLATGVYTDSPAGAASEDTLETFTILTTAATTAVATVHHRMPVILPPSFFGSWLEGRDVPLKPASDVELKLRPVSHRVNSAAYDEPGCIEPPQPSLF